MPAVIINERFPCQRAGENNYLPSPPPPTDKSRVSKTERQQTRAHRLVGKEGGEGSRRGRESQRQRQREREGEDETIFFSRTNCINTRRAKRKNDAFIVNYSKQFKQLPIIGFNLFRKNKTAPRHHIKQTLPLRPLSSANKYAVGGSGSQVYLKSAAPQAASQNGHKKSRAGSSKLWLPQAVRVLAVDSVKGQLGLS